MNEPRGIVGFVFDDPGSDIHAALERLISRMGYTIIEIVFNNEENGFTRAYLLAEQNNHILIYAEDPRWHYNEFMFFYF